MTLATTFLTRLGAVCLSGIVVSLAACGGAHETDPPAGSSGASSALSRQVDSGSATGSTPAQEAAQLAQGARLSSADLQAAELQAQTLDQAAVEKTGPTDPLASLLPGQIAPKSAYLSGDVARKAAAVRIPAYRFYNGSTGAHFYTVSETERANVAATLSPPYSFEGPAFSVANEFSPGLSPVHRFFNSQSGVHFYTISETERANVVANLPQFTYEGVAYHASPVAGVGLVPLYRFYVPSRGFHFYTASLAERDNIIATLSATYSYENIGYHVLASDWRAEKLPHTGVTSAQCYQGSSNTLVACSSASAYPEQDGKRVSVNPMSYSAVGIHPRTSCVRDNVTGLIWEGKEASGARSDSNTFTHLGNNAATDTSGYLAAVNASNLCGYNDWRLPSRQELLTLVDYGITTGPRLNTTWFPNTANGSSWSAEVLGTAASNAWTVAFSANGGTTDPTLRTNTRGLRLVRGSAPQGPRFSYSTVAYGSDAANNLVNDAWTGLQWRRCEQGRTWSGSTCEGSASQLTHSQALATAGFAGIFNGGVWRLPNVKELASLTDLSVTSGARINPVAFPGADNETQWSSSPAVGDVNRAWIAVFDDGGAYVSYRDVSYAVRLVRVSQ